jgi:hypothetical protein
MKAFRRMYIYKETNLPSVGWLQGCFICYAITGNCELFSRKETMRKTTEHVVYLCPICKKLVKSNDKVRQEYIRKVKSYINSHTG